MSFLKNILGAFVEFKEQTNATETPQKQEAKETDQTENITAEPVRAGISQASIVNTSSTGSNTANSNQYQKHFEELIEEANSKNPFFQGTDFKEFVDSKIDVQDIADEAIRYRTTFNVLKRTGLTKEKLVSTGLEYINVIDRDVKAFESAFIEQYKNQVQLKEQQLQQKAQELQLLSEKIDRLNKEVKQFSDEVVVSKNRLNTNKSLFVSAAESKKKEIENELKKINEYFS